MNVGFITAWAAPSNGGIFEATRRLAAELSLLAGVRVQAFGLSDALTDPAVWNGVPLVAIAPRGPRAFGFAPGLQRRLQAATLDLLHAHEIWMYPAAVAGRWFRSARRPVLVSTHGMLEPWAIRQSRWKKLLAGRLYARRLLRDAACLHALCEAEARSLRAYGLTNPICVIPNGVDLPDCSHNTKAPAWRAELPGHAKVLLYLGRLHPKKGLANLLQAWAAVTRTIPHSEWRLAIAGWDQNGHELELKRLARALDIQDTVRFLGPQFHAAKDQAFRSANAFVLPSFSEGLPVAALEAWSYRLPVLMTPQCNIPEAFACAAAIRLDTDPASITAALNTLFSMPETTLRQLGRSGFQLVRQRYLWAHTAAQMRRVYSWLLGDGEKPDSIV